jgi:hypothetical protein
MMRKLLVLTVMAGCGGGFCKKQAKVTEDCGTPVNDASIEACEESLEGCSGSDEAKLSAFADCVNDLAPCGETMTDTSDMFAMLGCLGELEGLSPECGSLTFGTPMTTTTLSQSR